MGDLNMDTAYLDTMPEVKNRFKAELLPGEKVVFTAKMLGFFSDSDHLLGADKSRFTMTNRRILADNGQGIWITDIAEDVVDMRREERGKFLMKEVYIKVTMNKEVTYGIGIHKLSGYRFGFRKKDMAAFEEIIRRM